MRRVAPLIGFFEVTIWVLAVSGTLKHLGNPLALLAYGTGFAVATALGMRLERALAVGAVTMRAINSDADLALAERLREAGYAATQMMGQGRAGPVEICLCAVDRPQVGALQQVVEDLAPRAFVTFEDLRSSLGGVLRPLPAACRSPWRRLLRPR